MTLTEVFVQGFGELVESRRDLQPLLENPPLPLNTNHLRPFHEPSQILLWWQRTTDSELLGPLLEQWIHHLRLSRFLL